jgi:hypothetical protein
MKPSDHTRLYLFTEASVRWSSFNLFCSSFLFVLSSMFSASQRAMPSSRCRISACLSPTLCTYRAQAVRLWTAHLGCH